MKETLEFIFSDWKHFVGLIILILVAAAAAEEVVRAFRK